MKIGFAGTGYINKIHAQAAQTLGLELVAGGRPTRIALKQALSSMGSKALARCSPPG